MIHMVGRPVGHSDVFLFRLYYNDDDDDVVVVLFFFYEL